MIRFRRRAYRDQPVHRPAPYGFTAGQHAAWLDAICALQIFRVGVGRRDCP